MDRYWELNGAPQAPAAPTANSGGYPTDGNPALNTPPTTPGAWWYHMVTEEIRNACVALGGAPDFSETDQLGKAILAAFASSLGQIQSGAVTYALDTSKAANQITIALTPAVTAYTDGQVFHFEAANANISTTNGGGCTFNAGPGNIPLQSGAGAFQGGEIVAGKQYSAIYNAALNAAVLIGQAGGSVPVATATQSKHAIQFGQVQAGVNYAAAGGTADALTATLASGLTALTDGFSVTIKAAAANATTTPTLNLTLGSTATGAKTIVKGAGAALVAGDIAGANHELQLTYNATLGEWVLNNPATGVASTARATTSVAGIAELATQAMVSAGTDNTTIVTPATLAGLGLNSLINNTNATSDLALQIGQGAYLDIVALTTVPLHIATGDLQCYDITLLLNGATGYSNAGQVLLLPNNATLTNMFFEQTANAAGLNGGAASAYTNGLCIGLSDVRTLKAVVNTRTASKSTVSVWAAWGTSTTIFAAETVSTWLSAASNAATLDTTTVWSSLGTVTFPVAATGRIIIRRIA